MITNNIFIKWAIALALIFPITICHATVLGTVIKNKGHATILKPSSIKAQDAKINQKIVDESSIFCHDQCYLTIAFNNDLTYLKLGKQSKISLNYEPSQKSLYVHLYTGYLKLLFKSGKIFERVLIKTPNSKIEAQNTSLLVSYLPLLNRSSALNFKGSATFYKNGPEGGREVVLENNSYSVINKSSSSASEPEFLSPAKLQALKTAFEVEDADPLKI